MVRLSLAFTQQAVETKQLDLTEDNGEAPAVLLLPSTQLEVSVSGNEATLSLRSCKKPGRCHDKLQTNADTQSKQIAAWCDLVLSYYRQSKQYILDVTEAQSSPLFHNAVINRKLPLEAVNVVLSSLERKGHVEWEDATKRTRCYVMWRTPEEWAALIFQWVASKGFTNTVCTYYDLHSGDDAADQEFFGMDLWMLKKSLRVLQTQGKAELMQGTQADDSDGGIKFFS